MSTVISTAVGVLIGGSISWLATWFYYRRAGTELRQEAAALRHLNNLILRALEAAGLAKLARDESGEIKGLRFELKAESGVYAISGTDADLTVKRSGPAA